jgi:hypothetical protein
MKKETESGGLEGKAGQGSKYIRNSSTISGRLDDEMVMMDIEQGKYFALNPVATRIWELLESPLTIDELCILLIEEYEVDETLCRAETAACIDDMVRFGLVLDSAG